MSEVLADTPALLQKLRQRGADIRRPRRVFELGENVAVQRAHPPGERCGGGEEFRRHPAQFGCERDVGRWLQKVVQLTTARLVHLACFAEREIQPLQHVAHRAGGNRAFRSDGEAVVAEGDGDGLDVIAEVVHVRLDAHGRVQLHHVARHRLPRGVPRAQAQLRERLGGGRGIRVLGGVLDEEKHGAASTQDVEGLVVKIVVADGNRKALQTIRQIIKPVPQQGRARAGLVREIG
jgi:hypothetical protein